jgi:UDP-N-acetylmuramate dehydrogenase
VGDAEVSEKHGNFFVNRGNATAGEMMALMRTVQNRVKRDSGISLEPEVHLL